MTAAVKKSNEQSVSEFLEDLKARGMRIEEIATKMGVSYSTLMSWKAKLRTPPKKMKILIDLMFGVKIV